jgi:hypothetical protein
MTRHPLSVQASRAVLVCCGGLAGVAILAGAVRVLPWMLDPNVPMRVALPFVRGVLELAVEAAVLVGWPLGWALAASQFAERGEARVMMLLGESPLEAARAQWRSAIPAAVALGLAAFLGAVDASAPGRMAQDLVDEGQHACGHVTVPRTYGIPFVSLTWLCAPGMTPRLYGSGPGSLRSIVFSATDTRIAPDMRRIELEEARFSVPLSSSHVGVHAQSVVLHGMAPWTHASSVPPVLHMLVVVTAGLLAAALSLMMVLSRLVRGTLAAVLVAVSGPLATLGLMRALERADVPSAVYLVTPVVAVASVLGLALLTRLRSRWLTASRSK